MAQLSVWYQVGNISATHSSILAHKIPWTSEPGGLQSMGSQKSQIPLSTNTHTHRQQQPVRLVALGTNLVCTEDRKGAKDRKAPP